MKNDDRLLPSLSPALTSTGTEPSIEASINARERTFLLLDGEFDVASIARLQAVLQDALRRDPLVITIDATKVSFMDAGTLGLLVDTRRECIDRAIELELLPSPFVRRLFAVASVEYLVGPSS